MPAASRTRRTELFAGNAGILPAALLCDAIQISQISPAILPFIFYFPE